MKKSILMILISLLNLPNFLQAAWLCCNLSRSIHDVIQPEQRSSDLQQVDIPKKNKYFTCYAQLPQELHYIIADYAGLNSPQPSYRGESLLQKNIKHRDFSAVATLINCGALINGMTPENQTTPLYLAVRELRFSYETSGPVSWKKKGIQDSFKILHFLIIKHADLDQQSPKRSHQTALHQAACIGDSPLPLHILIRAGANVNIKDEFEKTALDRPRVSAMSHHLHPITRTKYYKNCECLVKTGAQSSIELKAIPSFEVMKRQWQNNFYNKTK